MSLKRTPPSGPGSLWIGGRVSTAIPHNTPAPAPAPAEAVIWLDATRDVILAARVVPAAEADAVFVVLLLQAVRGRRDVLPERVRVASERDAVRVRGVLPAAAIEVGPTPELVRIEPVISGARGSNEEYDASCLHGGALEPAEMARYFEHMATLWQVAPWRSFSDRQGLELDVPAMDIRGACVAVLGGAGQIFGAVVFESFADFQQFHANADLLSTAPGSERPPLGAASLGLIFHRGADLPDEMRLEVARHGWRVVNADAYPLLVPLDPDAQLLAATPRDLRLGCVVSVALASLVRQHARRLRDGGADDCLTCVSLECPERVEAVLWSPHSRVRPDVQGRRPRSRVGSGREHAQADQWLVAFHESDNVRRRAQAWRGTAVYMISMLHDFRLDVLRVRLEGLRVWQLSEFVLDFVPRDVLADADMVRDTPEVIDAYLQWLGEAGHEDALKMARMRTLARRWRRTFARKALDPEAFSPAKTFALSAQAAGVDLEDFAAVAAHHERFERVSELALGFIQPRNVPRAVRVHPVATKSKPGKPRRRFVFEREPLPGPELTCPCGSGRAFGRCCMPE